MRCSKEKVDCPEFVPYYDWVREQVKKRISASARCDSLVCTPSRSSHSKAIFDFAGCE